jgi:hypothetical protein
MFCISDDAPRFEETETEQHVRAEEGNYVVLHCVARGRPVPTITWTKGAMLVCLLHMGSSFIGKLNFHYTCMNRDSLGSILTKVWAGRLRNQFDIWQQQEIFLFCKASRPAQAHQPG